MRSLWLFLSSWYAPGLKFNIAPQAKTKPSANDVGPLSSPYRRSRTTPKHFWADEVTHTISEWVSHRAHLHQFIHILSSPLSPCTFLPLGFLSYISLLSSLLLPSALFFSSPLFCLLTRHVLFLLFKTVTQIICPSGSHPLYLVAHTQMHTCHKHSTDWNLNSNQPNGVNITGKITLKSCSQTSICSITETCFPIITGLECWPLWCPDLTVKKDQQNTSNGRWTEKLTNQTRFAARGWFN